MYQQLQIQGDTALYKPEGAPEPNPWAYPTFAAVGPRGQLVVRHLTPDYGEIGDVPIKMLSKRLTLCPAYAELGWVSYEDLCKGRVAGVEADLDAWKRWESLCKHNATGKRLPEQLLDESKLLHPEVIRRRKHGLGVLPSVEEFKAQFPGDFDWGEAEKSAKRGEKGSK